MSDVVALTRSDAWGLTKGRLEAYFDRTALDAWTALTSDAPVSRVRATVRAGRDRMRATILDWLPADMTGLTLLDAGCGTGALAVEAARRGAQVTAIDVSPSLISIAVERAPRELHDRLRFLSGDMLDIALGRFDHIVAMDSLIHYPAATIASAARTLAARADRSLVFTVAPATPLLRAMHAVGQLFPRGDRSPAIVPVATDKLRRAIGARGRDARISAGFYISHAVEVVR
ncbi:MAG TPA: magnesium protoporphyrin IX methyltransferase [Sphingomonas sp.]|jgi:magnesium-protoporphyrin O-methyltransferase|nr:magnesium protoporphyrin IX methyltransferase [Sphingomonas sp.]